MNQDIKIFTTEKPNKKYESLGIVNGIQVKSMNVFTEIMTDIANVFGTGKKDWSKVKNLFDETREEAVQEMKNNALTLGANAVIGVRIDVSELSRGSGQGMLVVAAYGTAIKKHMKGDTKKLKTKYNKKIKDHKHHKEFYHFKTYKK